MAITERTIFPEKQGLLTRVFAVDAPQTCKNINVLMLGIITSGKSSLTNTFHTVLRNNGHISNLCAVSGPHVESTTKKLQRITIQGLQNGTQFNIFDCRGVRACDKARCKEIQHVFEDDLIKVIHGHIMKDYKFDETATIKEDHEKYRNNPTDADKMHCVLFVMKAENIDRDVNDHTLRRMLEYLKANNIPCRVILTAVDKLDLCGYGHLNDVFKSRDVKLKVQTAKSKFDLQANQILPVANYVDETTQDIIKDVLALQAIENILQEAVGYLDSVI
uniref:Uncharacterized protein LOC111109495 isoform X2 n=1 Tax=Crassostrea virginica TaxID=6565 RepID=A0A8B8BEA6_CRAVI|nr:uncharacterized protein LOC111109495 isoform X2 [Crassostrea virginica]